MFDVGYLRDADVMYLYLYGSEPTVNVMDSVFVGAFARSIVTLVSGLYSTSLLRNEFSDIECRNDCFKLITQELMMSSNTISSISIREPNAIVVVNSDNPRLTENRFEDCSGYIMLELNAAPVSPGFENNVVVGNVTFFQYLVATTTAFETLEGGRYLLNANFWGTADFDILRAKTRDSAQVPSLASIEYSRIYIDESLGASIAAPPPSVFDEDAKTIGGTIFESLTVQVPVGLYYATSSIIVNNPDAELVFEAGVRIMFPPSATIHVREGTFQVLGTSVNPVVLASTSVFATEYGDPDIVESDQWGGLYFGPNVNSTTLLDAEYVDGSLLRHCQIINAGFGGVLSAAVEMESSTILMENVDIEDSGSRGVYVTGDSGFDMIMNDVQITGSLGFGLFTNNFKNVLSLGSLNITDSGATGAYLSYHGDVRVTSSTFVGNSDRQLYSRFGVGDLSVSDR